MNKITPKAINVAMAVYKQPNQFVAPKIGSYPSSMLDVIKAAGGDEITLKINSDELGVPDDQISQACKFYLQKLLASAGDDPFRMMALDYGVSDAEIKDHKRWLLKWLHPDRNPSKWEAKFFLAVNRAAQQLESKADGERPSVTFLHQPKGKLSSHRLGPKNRIPRRKPVNIFTALKPFFLSMSIAIAVVLIFIGVISNWQLISHTLK